MEVVKTYVKHGIVLQATVFVFQPTNRMSMAQGLFKVGPGAGP